MRKREICGLATCKDISSTGIRLVLPKGVERGDRLELNFSLPVDGAQPISTLAEVVWKKRISKSEREARFDTWMKFIKFSPKDNERFILQFCETMVDIYGLDGRARHRRKRK